jgi:3-oxoacyl-[acyl-carrier protein] reductase
LNAGAAHDLSGRVAIVTGAGRMRSIGRGIALALARAGCDVAAVGSGRTRDQMPEDEASAGWRDVDSVADEVRGLGRRALAVRADIADEDAVRSLVETVVAEMGRVDILVNNASAALGADRTPVLDLEPQLWRKVLDVNLTGTFLMSKYVGRVLVDQGSGGAIVNISSVAGKVFPANSAAYAASKAGVHALTGSLARELAQFGVRVNAVLPGLIDTSRMDGLGRGDAWEQLVTDNIPLGRAGTPEDVADLVVFLCSDESTWITGQQYVIDGGRAIGN